MEGQCSPHQDAQSQDLSYAQLVETSQSGWSDNWGSLGTSCVEALRAPLEEYQSWERKKGQGPWQIWARPHVSHG